MNDLGTTLASILKEQQVTQTSLSRITGVPQPRLSAYVNGQTGLSLDMLAYLLAALGYSLEVTVSTSPANLNRSERRQWLMHRALAGKLDAHSLDSWKSRIEENLSQLRTSVQGEPHETNLARWEHLLHHGDIRDWKLVMISVDTDSIAMREVSPLAGLLSEEERMDALEGRLP